MIRFPKSARSSRVPAPASILSLIVTVITLCFFACCFTGCNSPAYPDRDPGRLEDARVDALEFWPGNLRYALTGDTVSLRVLGLQRGYVCSKLLEANWTLVDSTAGDYYGLHTVIELPGTPHCAVDTGLDILYKRPFPNAAGEKLYLRRLQESPKDSLLFVGGAAFNETLTYFISDSDSVYTVGRFRLHDSTAESPRRFFTGDSLAACETFQVALSVRRGDTVSVRLRRLVATPLPAALFPPCAGPHVDTMEVVPDLFRYP